MTKIGTKNSQDEPRTPGDIRWNYWTNLTGLQALAYLRNRVCSWFRNMGQVILSPYSGTITSAEECGKHPCVRMIAMGEWQMDPGRCKYAFSEGKELERFLLQPGDALLASASGRRAYPVKLSSLGKSSVVFGSRLMKIGTSPSRLINLGLICWLKTGGGRARFM